MNKEKLSIVKTKYAINGTTTYCEITFKFRAMPFIVAAFKNHQATTALKSNVTPNIELIKNNLTIGCCSINDILCLYNRQFFFVHNNVI